ncbi:MULTISPECIES: LysE family translocator [Paenibacillus]|uniref:LysE family translocator n=1 Tax=Paenibacillus TaxID=44249 RepID=UPI000589D021|nr:MULTISPECIES: LysE family transporter [Paenibacillus]AJE50566.1 lysine transporter LysE [Paenibacillus polymyxa]MBU9707083.1 LysE family translocator [Paenibacillus sp. AK121]MEE4566416.1 LysE family transporter [Paenibacillus polymyxa]QOH61050.1 lysine transporter LysE [Paenibacillus polymyxa]
MALFITYVLLGFSIALPVGTITVEMTKQGLKNGFMHGWIVGLGGMTIDLLLIIGLYFGLASVLSLPVVQVIMWLVGAIFLCYVGYDSIKNADHDIALEGEKKTKSLFSSYKNGLLVAVSPGNLVFWVSVFGTVLASSFDRSNTSQFLIVGLGILFGILVHDLGLMTLVATTRKAMNRTAIKWVTICAGVVLIVFSVYFLYEFMVSLQKIL